MHHLTFDLSEDAQGVLVLEAMASTPAAQHAAVMAEVQALLDWAGREAPHGHGPLDEGMVWHHDLQVAVEDGHWHAVTLTVAGRPDFITALLAAFGIEPGS